MLSNPLVGWQRTVGVNVRWLLSPGWNAAGEAFCSCPAQTFGLGPCASWAGWPKQSAGLQAERGSRNCVANKLKAPCVSACALWAGWPKQSAGLQAERGSRNCVANKLKTPCVSACALWAGWPKQSAGLQGWEATKVVLVVFIWDCYINTSAENGGILHCFLPT